MKARIPYSENMFLFIIQAENSFATSAADLYNLNLYHTTQEVCIEWMTDNKLIKKLFASLANTTEAPIFTDSLY